jgi:allantoinase
LELIANAKKQDLPLTAETCAQYLYFNAEMLENVRPDGPVGRGKTIYKCVPPIREKENNEQLKAALKSGVLDFITTDHSPAPPSIKEIESGNLQKAWGGIAGIQFLLSASWTALKDTMTIEEFIPLLTEHPAKFIRIDDRKGKIAKGYDADLLLWDPERNAVIKEANILFKHKISPYIGESLYGVISRTYVNGNLVFAENFVKHKNAGELI